MINIDSIFHTPFIVLNKIVPDLQSIIKEYYRTYPKFIIGLYSASYGGYRPVEKNDFRDPFFMRLLSTWYRENQGFLSLGDFKGNVLYCLDGVLCYNDYSLRLSSEPYGNMEISKGKNYLFQTFNHLHYIITNNMDQIYVSNLCYTPYPDDCIKLFIKDN